MAISVEAENHSRENQKPSTTIAAFLHTQWHTTPAQNRQHTSNGVPQEYSARATSNRQIKEITTHHQQTHTRSGKLLHLSKPVRIQRKVLTPALHSPPRHSLRPQNALQAPARQPGEGNATGTRRPGNKEGQTRPPPCRSVGT